MTTSTLETLEASPHARGAATTGVGVRIGRYITLDPLGAGAMGVVYAAYDPELDRKVALKLIKYERADEGDENRLQREAQALARLDHRNVVTVHDVGIHEGRLFVAMEFVAGQTLRSWMRAESARPWRETLAVFIAAGQGLAAAHRAGLVHRDFKPANVMFGEDGRVRVMDFGLVRMVADEDTDAYPSTEHRPDAGRSAPTMLSGPAMLSGPGLTQTGALLGTPAYMSPEQSERRTLDARTDQFSFCVALYEALYGCRPFLSADIGERLDAIASGRLETATRGAKIPGRLQRILARGLVADPDQRWPSMDALLDALSDDPGLRWRKRGLAALAVSALVGGALVGGLALQRDDQTCAGMDAHLVGVWDATRRDAVRAAIEGTELSYAASTWVRVERGLDDYTQRWLGARVEACEATHRGEQSAQLLDLRMGCLDERLRHVRATVEALSEADEAGVIAAGKIVAGLPSIERCADAEALTAEFPLPEDPLLAARIGELSEQVLAAEVLADMAKHDQSRALITEVAREASGLDHAPLELEIALLRGELRRDLGDHEGAMESFEQALDLALRHGMSGEAARASSELMVVSARGLADEEGSRRWAQLAEPLVVADGREGMLAMFIMYRGLAAAARGDHELALVDHERALALRERIHGAKSHMVATSLNNVGYSLQRLGRFAEARAINERALILDEELRGPEHPDTASTLHNLGNLAKAAGDLSAATRFHARALAIREQAFGAEHPDVGGSLNSLGSLAKRRGELDEAQAYYLRALAIFELHFGPEHPYVAGTLNNLGAVAIKLGDYEGAQSHLDRALELVVARRGPDHPETALTIYNLAELANAQGEFARARDQFSRALALFEGSMPPEHATIATTMTVLGLVYLSLEDAPTALELLERAFELRSKGEAMPIDFAQTHHGLARALWEVPAGQGRDRVRALELTRRARELVGEGVEGEQLRAKIDAWLREHELPQEMSSDP